MLSAGVSCVADGVLAPHVTYAASCERWPVRALSPSTGLVSHVQPWAFQAAGNH
jgi:hypothetical protein